MNTGLLPLEDLLTCLDGLECEVVLTGRDPRPPVSGAGRLYYLHGAVRHPFEQGISARKGIEF